VTSDRPAGNGLQVHRSGAVRMPRNIQWYREALRALEEDEQEMKQ
jgi:hypothetical protein